MSGVSHISLKELNINITNALIIGIIIGKRSWRKFASVAKNERAVWSFTLRGSPQDCINVTCWGSSQYIKTLHNSYHVGDVVNIIKPQIKSRSPGDRNESFTPSVNSPFVLILNEGQSDIQLHDGDDLATYNDMLSIPTKKLTKTYTLYDIQTNGVGMRGQQADILVGVRTVGPIKTVKSKNDDEELHARDIIIMDQTSPGFSITLWEDDEILRASTWQPRATVLFMTDVRIEIRNNRPIIVLTSQTIITVNPNDPLTKNLRDYMNNTTPAPISMRSFVVPNVPLPNPQFIQNVISVGQLYKKIEIFNLNSDLDVNFSGLIYCFVTNIDLKINSAIIKKCGICKQKIDSQIGVCFNLECPVGSGSESIGPIKEFDILLDLTDHTGSIKNAHLQDKCAERILGYTPTEFEELPDYFRDKMKWDFLLERCEIRVMLYRNGAGKINVIVLSYSTIEDYGEVAQKLPLF